MELRFLEEVGEKFHCVCSEAGCVLIQTWTAGRSGGGIGLDLVAEGFYFLLDEFCY